jgi:lipopolysaccharide/colanic/teichoic acid biosynthesis glycosyltransferase
MPSMFRSLSAGLRVDMAGVIPLVGPRNSKIEGLNFIIKRAFDVSLASVILLLASPVLLLAALAIWLFDGRPLLFRQTRIGLHGEPFELLKFRTMGPLSSDATHREYVRKWIKDNAAAADRNGKSVFKLSSDDRVTPVGRWLRRFSIDELPQLFNVLRGEMSLIGPRPALPYEIDLYQDWHHRRLEAPPGITGLWQVSGRNHLSFEDMVRLDIKYIEDWSLGRDLAILLRTVPAILHGGGV